MPQELIKNGELKMKKAIEALENEFALVRTGRANPAVLKNVVVPYYGVSTPINQIATISVPEAQQLLIKPFDKNIVKDIEKAIQVADLNLTPLNDGDVIRINFPALTEERRRELVRDVKAIGENSKISIRNIRRDLNDEIKKLEKSGSISEDEEIRHSDAIQKMTDKFTTKIDDLVTEKEKSIMTI